MTLRQTVLTLVGYFRRKTVSHRQTVLTLVEYFRRKTMSLR